MKDVQDILRRIRQLEAQGRAWVMATVVRIAGSAYRGPGTRMLLTPDQGSVGTLSGGCLERDVLEQAQEVFASGEPRLLSYDATTEADLLWGTGLGCSGVVEVLLERHPCAGPDYLAFLRQCVFEGDSGILATVFAAEGGAAQVGQRLILRRDFEFEDDLQNEELRAALGADARRILAQVQRERKSFVQGLSRRYEVGAGAAEVLLETALPPPSLALLGAGHDAVPLARLAAELGWRVWVVDRRPPFARPERFPEARQVILAHAEELAARLPLEEFNAVLVMTHNYLEDRKLLHHLLRTPPPYLGVLGPRKRTGRLLEELGREGIEPTAEQLERFFSPVGLDIGAESAEEIALSILGEIQAVLAGRQGGFLRRRRGSIHERPA